MGSGRGVSIWVAVFSFTFFLSFVSQGAIGLRPFYVCLLEWKSLLHKE